MADKVFNIKFNVDGNVGPLKSALDGIRGSFEKLKLPDNLGKNFEGTLSKLENELKHFSELASKPINNMKDVKNIENSYEKVSSLFAKVQSEISHMKGLDPEKLLPSSIIERTKAIQRAFIDYKKAVVEAGKTQSDIGKKETSLEKQVQKFNDAGARIEELSNKIKKLKNELKTLDNPSANRVAGLKAAQTNARNKYGEDSEQYKNATKKYEEATKAAENYARVQERINKLDSQKNNKVADYEAANTKIKELNAALEELRGKSDNSEASLKKVRDLLKDFTGAASLKDIPKDPQKIAEMISQLNVGRVNETKQGLEGLGNAAKSAEGPLGKVEQRVNEIGTAGRGINERAQDIQRLADRAKYFFSVTNSIQLFKRTVRSAFNTIKDLDESMTQAAVVTCGVCYHNMQSAPMHLECP